MIKVLIVDDSATVREFLVEVLAADQEIRVIGAVKEGAAALDFLQRERPDVITMDIEMPRMNGFEATRKIMETNPVPVVIVSGLSLAEQRATFRAVEAGALAVVSRPHGPGHADFAKSVQKFIDTVKTMAGVKVVRRWPKVREVEAAVSLPVPVEAPRGTPKIVGIGASTGGPAALNSILSALPSDFPFPIVLVQHMTRGFLQGFADWLGSTTRKRVQLAVNEEKLEPGRIYLAPEAVQMGVNASGRIILQKPSILRPSDLCPSVSWLFQSLADSYGPAAAGVLLTGMGRDGADSLKLMKDRGAITIVQSAESCIVNGMPNAAIQLNAASYVLSPQQISATLVRFAAGTWGSRG